MITTELLRQRLELVFDWYRGMVNPNTGMLEYLYSPDTDRFVRENCPIRDIASVWDMEVLGDFLTRDELKPVVEKSLRFFGDYLVEESDGDMVLDSGKLEEPSSIAHSSFMLLALLDTSSPLPRQKIVGLTEGILHQQRSNGSYKIYFDDLPDQGEELYAGEAMLALLEAHRPLQDSRCFESAEQAFDYYDKNYWRAGRVSDDLLVFFANWQSQACRLLFECTENAPIKPEVARYLLAMQDAIIDRGFYRDIEHHPERQSSVEVACALEGLNDAYSVARILGDEHTERYHQCICSGLEYLLTLQCTSGGNPRERGGFGLTLSQHTQRIDITGHAASAFMKSVENEVECR